jgi:hypothetical protein
MFNSYLEELVIETSNFSGPTFDRKQQRKLQELINLNKHAYGAWENEFKKKFFFEKSQKM